MPSGRTHDSITLWGLPWLVGGSWWITSSGELALIVSGGYLFSGLMFGPDLDIHSIQFKRWGKLRIIWLPYQKIIRHRSLLSHGIIIGTVIRLIYLLTILGLLVLIFLTLAMTLKLYPVEWQTVTRSFTHSITEHPYEVIALVTGLEIGSCSHIISDRTISWYKSKTRKRKKRRTKP